ncbi:MAG: ABC transporter substrate-binding protein [Promethearchaeota archaeon]
MLYKKRLIIVIFLFSLFCVFILKLNIVNQILSNKITTSAQTDSYIVKNKCDQVSYPFSLIDGHDRNVTIVKEPQDIISIAPSVTEVIYAVGAGDKLIAVDPNSNYPNETTILPKIGNYPTLDIEKIMALEPDLIFGADITSSDDVEKLENQGYTVFILAPFNVEDVLEDIEVVGLITNHESEANILKNSLQEQIDGIKHNATTLTFKPKIYIEYFSEPLFTFGKGTYGHNLIELAGGINIAENATNPYPQIDDEFVITQNPDIIFYAKGPWTTTNVSTIGNRKGWNIINAVKNGNIYPINEDWISRGGPRIVKALEEIHSKVKLVASPSDSDQSVTPDSDQSVTPAFEWCWVLLMIPISVFIAVKRRP